MYNLYLHFKDFFYVNEPLCGPLSHYKKLQGTYCFKICFYELCLLIDILEHRNSDIHDVPKAKAEEYAPQKTTRTQREPHTSC